jgi:hypothetical protein
MGANFNEYLIMLNYQYKRVYASYKFSYTQAGADSTLNTNFGNNVREIAALASNTTNVKVQNGIPYSVMDNEIKIGYIVNAKIKYGYRSKNAIQKLQHQICWRKRL